MIVTENNRRYKRALDAARRLGYVVRIEKERFAVYRLGDAGEPLATFGALGEVGAWVSKCQERAAGEMRTARTSGRAWLVSLWPRGDDGGRDQVEVIADDQDAARVAGIAMWESARGRRLPAWVDVRVERHPPRPARP